MEAASTGGERVRLQDAIRGGVTWLSHNGSNPDVATKSAEVCVCVCVTSFRSIYILQSEVWSQL